MTRAGGIAGACVLALVLAVVPFTSAGSDRILLVNIVLIYAIFAVGFDLAFGFTGLFSLAHAALFGVGGYTLALLTTRLQVPFEAALLAAGLAGLALAGIIGFFSLRMSGIFFALTTLSFAQLCYILAGTRAQALTGGIDGLSGIPRPSLFGIDFNVDRNFYFYVVAVFVVLFAVAALIRTSPFGRVLRGIRLNDARIEQLGWHVNRYRGGIFMISGFYSGVAGALLASLLFYTSPQTMYWTTSGDVLIMTLLGGVGTLFGPILGVAAYEILKEELSQLTEHWYGVLGVVFILFTIFVPHGLVGLLSAGGRALGARARS